eukprot:TRINITY_DN64328_c1_g1_i1.p1 TRINITY_DN64328_c1_g1~~TRINITY_DN64328_c1_g1_i1.p1  ORF type:complete len:360 (-),score=24.66 TRINITY_DN64328_c1_g1_i1:454-1533(-)
MSQNKLRSPSHPQDHHLHLQLFYRLRKRKSGQCFMAATLIYQMKKNLQDFLASHTIYDVLPMNGQVLVFNTELSLYDAINALAEHNIFCGVMWDEGTRNFPDLFTIRDILEILVFMTEQLELQYPGKVHTLPVDNKEVVYEFMLMLSEKATQGKTHPMEMGDIDKAPTTIPSPATYEEPIGGVGYDFLFSILKNTKLADWARISSQIIEYKPGLLVKKSLKDSLLDACKEMANRKIHRLAIIEQGDKGPNLCGIITHDMIMGYIISNMQGDPRLFEVPIKELGLDTKELASKGYRSTLLQVLQCMRDNKISFLPIVNDQVPGGTASPVVGFFSLKDLIKLIRDKKYHMVAFTLITRPDR